VDRESAHHVYTVEHADGHWLWLTSGTIGGWAKAADVIPHERAIPGSVLALINRGNSS
jgi:hypothetical protein